MKAGTRDSGVGILRKRGEAATLHEIEGRDHGNVQERVSSVILDFDKYG
jgi:hypothetical protein